MKTTFTVVAGVGALLSTLTSCTKEEPPSLNDAPALPEGTITLDKAKAYFVQNSSGSVAAMNRSELRLDTALFSTSLSNSSTPSKTLSSASMMILPEWNQSVIITNPKFSTLRIPLSNNVSGITRINTGNDSVPQYKEADVQSSLIVQQLYGDGRMRQYVETVIKSGKGLTNDSYVLITDVAGEFLWCDRWKNGKRSDMAVIGGKTSPAMAAHERKLFLNSILTRSIWDTNEIGEIEVVAPGGGGGSTQNNCSFCGQDPCACWFCPFCGSRYCNGQDCRPTPPPDPGGGGNPITPDSPGFTPVKIKMDTATQKIINKILKQINQDCMGQKLLGALNYSLGKDLTIRYAPNEVGADARGRYNQPSHTIILGTNSLSTLTEELFHAYQGYNPDMAYTISAKLNYEIEAKVATAQVIERTGEKNKLLAGQIAVDFHNFCNEYAKAPTMSQYNTLIIYLRDYVGYSSDKYPESYSYRNLNTLTTLSSDCVTNMNN